MEAAIRAMAMAIKEYYIDEDKAIEVHDKIMRFLKSPPWERYLNTGHTPRLILHLNSIITTTTDDYHFYVHGSRPPTSSTSPTSGASHTGIGKITPHYIEISHFARLENEYIRAIIITAFAQFRDYLIIDLRDCPGGNPEMTYFLLSHLFPDGTPLFKLIRRHSEPMLFKAASTFPFYANFNSVRKFTGRVSVLVNGATGSAAESLAFVLQNRKRATIYGPRTAAAAHVEMSMALEGLTLHIPCAKTVDPETGKDWEGTGIVPDYDITSKEFIDFMYREVSLNYLLPIDKTLSDVKLPNDKQPSDVKLPNDKQPSDVKKQGGQKTLPANPFSMPAICN